MGPSQLIERLVFEWLFKQTPAGAPPAELWVSLHTADPADIGSAEVSGNNYGRAQLDPDVDNLTAINWNTIDQASEPTSVSNKLVVQFPQAQGGPWNGGAACTHFGLWDQSTAGVFFWSGTVAGGVGVIVTEGLAPAFAAGSPGQLVCTLR